MGQQVVTRTLQALSNDATIRAFDIEIDAVNISI
jgi:hypothetical protein